MIATSRPGTTRKGACVDDPKADDGCVIFDLFGGFERIPGKLMRRPIKFSPVRASVDSTRGQAEGHYRRLNRNVLSQNPEDNREALRNTEIDAVANLDGCWHLSFRQTKPEFLGLLAEGIEYLDAHTFSDLYLVVCPADERVSYRTVYVGESFGLRIDANYGDRPRARLGSRPWRSWATVWACLTAHPFDTDGDRWGWPLDANKQRIEELQARELEKGAHLHMETVDHHEIAVGGDHLERITKDDGRPYYRLPKSDDPLDRGNSVALAHGDLLPIQQLVRMDEEMLRSTASFLPTRLAATLWKARADSSVGDNPWESGSKDITEHINMVT